MKLPVRVYLYETDGEIYPSAQLAYNGSTVSITCYSQRGPKWTKDGIPLRFGGHTLTLANVKEEQSGTYICKGFYENRPRKKFVAHSDLYVGGSYYL